MLILVTGATGRIGSQLTRALVRRGHRVRAFASEEHPNAAAIACPQVDFAAGRLEDTDALNAAAKGVDAVFHLAAGLGSRGHDEGQIFSLGLGATFQLLRAVRAGAPKCQRFLYASSDAVYWSGSRIAAAYLPVDEAHPRLSGSVYGAVKIGCEEMSLTFWRAWGTPVTILRFGATANAAELPNPRGRFSPWLFLRRAVESLEGQPETSLADLESLRVLRALDNDMDPMVIYAKSDGTPEVRQWADARDIAEGCCLALESSAAIGETFNLGGVAPFTAAEQVNYLAAKLGRSVVTGCMPMVREPWYISSAKARGILGYRPKWTIFDMIDDGVR